MAEGARIDRRKLLRGAGAAGVGVALAGPLSGVASAGTAPALKLVAAYRLSTRGQDVCNACKAHGARRYFRLHRYANRFRAHLGCNCKILKQKISQGRWNRYFLRSDGSLRKQWDTRWRRT